MRLGRKKKNYGIVYLDLSACFAMHMRLFCNVTIPIADNLLSK